MPSQGQIPCHFLQIILSLFQMLRSLGGVSYLCEPPCGQNSSFSPVPLSRVHVIMRPAAGPRREERAFLLPMVWAPSVGPSPGQMLPALGLPRLSPGTGDKCWHKVKFSHIGLLCPQGPIDTKRREPFSWQEKTPVCTLSSGDNVLGVLLFSIGPFLPQAVTVFFCLAFVLFVTGNA